MYQRKLNQILARPHDERRRMQELFIHFVMFAESAPLASVGGAAAAAASVRSALRLVRGCLVLPVNALTRFPAVPNLGFVKVQAGIALLVLNY